MRVLVRLYVCTFVRLYASSLLYTSVFCCALLCFALLCFCGLGQSTTHLLLDKAFRDAMKPKEKYLPMLVSAVAMGCDDLIYSLIVAGVDVNVPAADFLTPLVVAAGCDNVPVAETLLRHGAKTEAPFFSNGLTPLHFAESRKMVLVLSSRGAANASALSAEGVGVVIPALAKYVANDEEHLALLVDIFGVKALDVPTHAQKLAATSEKGHMWPMVMEVAICVGHVRLVKTLLKYGFAKPERMHTPEWYADRLKHSAAGKVVMCALDNPDCTPCLKLVFPENFEGARVASP